MSKTKERAPAGDAEDAKRAKQLLDDCEKFIAKWRMTPSRFGQLAVNDDRFISRLRDGRRVWGRTEDKVRQFMKQYPPAR